MTAPEPACPHCFGPIVPGPDAWRCEACDATGRVLRGIPDLRTADDAYMANADDWRFALVLDEAFDRLDFRGLLDLHLDLTPGLRPDLRARQVHHILSAPTRVRAWLDALGPGVPDGPRLDLGCGSGSFLAATAAEGPPSIGVDVAFRWLLIARKRLDEEGLGRVGLVCGNAERLPFRDGSFAVVVAGDVLEHVADQAATLAESHRVLVDGGRLVAATPNRFSLAPEPHVGVWGVGFLPRRWMGAYVRLVRQIDFRAIRTLSAAEWTRTFRRSPFGRVSIACPPLAAAELAGMGPLKRGLARGYNRLTSTRAGQALLRLVGPLFHLDASRVGPPPPIPPTRRPTRP